MNDRDRRRRYPLREADNAGSLLGLPPKCIWWANWLKVAVVGPDDPDWLYCTRIIIEQLWVQHEGHQRAVRDVRGVLRHITGHRHDVRFGEEWGLELKYDTCKATRVRYVWTLDPRWLELCWGDEFGGVVKGRIVVHREGNIRRVVYRGRSLREIKLVPVLGDAVTPRNRRQ